MTGFSGASGTLVLLASLTSCGPAQPRAPIVTEQPQGYGLNLNAVSGTYSDGSGQFGTALLVTLRGDNGSGLEGHAFGKHVVKKGEFTDLGIKTREQFAKHIDNVVRNAKGRNVRVLSGERTAYWDDATGTVVIRNPNAPDMGTAFRPSTGRPYFEGLE